MFENIKIPDSLIPSDPRFGCGPSLIPLSFVDELQETGKHLLGTSHRQKAVRDLVREIAQGLQQYFQLPPDYLVVLGNGGATFLFDMISLGMVQKGSYHFTCGEFSQKWYKTAAQVPWNIAREESVPMGKGITPRDIVDDPQIDLLCMTLNETSTGVQLDTLPTVQSTERLVAIDATSGGGQIPCDLQKTDIFFFSPQKIFASEGGLWVAILSPKAIARAEKIEKDKSRYIPDIMRWSHAISNARLFQTYNTPSISTLFFLNQQIKRLNQLGYSEVCAQAEEKAQLIYQWAQQKPYLSPYVAEERYRSRAVATIDVQERFAVAELLKILHEMKIVYGIESYRKLERNQFRIALFHNILKSDLEKLLSLISFAFEKAGSERKLATN